MKNMPSTPICECGVIRSNWLITSKHLLLSIRVALEIMHLNNQASACLSNKVAQHGFRKKCHAKTPIVFNNNSIQKSKILSVSEAEPDSEIQLQTRSVAESDSMSL